MSNENSFQLESSQVTALWKAQGADRQQEEQSRGRT